MTNARSLRIRELNDAFRTTLAGEKSFFTPGAPNAGSRSASLLSQAPNAHLPSP